MVAEEIYPRDNYPEITELAMSKKEFKACWQHVYDGFKIIDKTR